MADHESTPESVPAATKIGRFTQPAVSVVLVIYPVAFGAVASRTWLNFSDNVYGVIAQAIAAFFIAVTIDLLSGRQSGLLRGHFAFTTYLLAGSWIGFFACMRAIMGTSSPLTVALSAGGLCASAIAVSVVLAERISTPHPMWRDAIVVLFVAPMVALLFI